MVECYQSILRAVISIFVPLANKIDIKFKNKMLTVLFGLITFCALFYSSVPIGVHLLIKCVIGCFILGLIIVFSINGPIKKVAWDKKFVSVWLIFGLIRLITGFVTSVEYLPLACVWLVVFPMLFLVWNNRKDYDTLFRALCNGLLYPILVFWILSLCLIPITEIGFVGLAGNPNVMGELLSAALPLLMVKYSQKVEKTGKNCNGLLAMIAFFIASTLYTDSRTTTLTVIVLIVAWICYTVFNTKRIRKNFYKALAKIFALAVFMYFAIVPVNSFLVPLIDYGSWCGIIYRSSGSFGSIEQEGIGFGKFSGETAEFSQIMNGYFDRISGNDKDESGMDNYSSGRTVIWRATINKLNLLGHPSKDHIYTQRNGDVGVNVHNTFLQFAYDHGIFGGILFIVFSILMVWKILFVLDTRSTYYENVLYISISFFVTALLTSINLPFLYILTLAFYVCCAIPFEDNGKSYKAVFLSFKTKLRKKI